MTINRIDTKGNDAKIAAMVLFLLANSVMTNMVKLVNQILPKYKNI
jgi:hypothetical protein